MRAKTKNTHQDQLGSLKALFTGYLKMRQRVDVVNKDLERFHIRITAQMLRLLADGKRVRM